MKKRGGHDRTSDDDEFAHAMEDVVRLAPDPRGRIRAAQPISAPPAAASIADNVDGPDEDFTASGVDRSEIRKLTRGEYAVGGLSDLHGLTVAQARASVRRFVDDSRQRHLRCVCIVHGRGLHSEGKVSVLKQHVREYLRSHRSVLAYANAPRSDGGAGAVYVLLRK